MPVLWGHPRKLSTLAELRAVALEGTYPFAHFFNGALVSLEAVRQVGNVDRDFFIFGDEVDYFFRLRKVGRVMSVLDALHFHPDVSQRPYSAGQGLLLPEEHADPQRALLQCGVAAPRHGARCGVGADGPVAMAWAWCCRCWPGRRRRCFIRRLHVACRARSERISMADIRALVAAAGRGTRAGLPYPKTLFPIQGKPILIRIAGTAGTLRQKSDCHCQPRGRCAGAAMPRRGRRDGASGGAACSARHG